MITFRGYGALGALLDEYEKAINEIIEVVQTIPHHSFTTVLDTETTDPDCVSFQSILFHVVRSGHGYINYIASIFGEHYEYKPDQPTSTTEVITALHQLMESTERYVMSKSIIPFDNPIWEKTIITRWNAIYNFEQVMEHAIVHVLRHRRQIQKFLHLIETT